MVHTLTGRYGFVAHGEAVFRRGRLGAAQRVKMRAMPTDLMVIIEDTPGELARLGEATGGAGINLRGLAAFTGEGRGVVHLLIDDAEVARARQALEQARIGIADEREVLVVDVAHRPGTLGELARMLAEANVNVELAYTTAGDGVKLVIATDDMASAERALG